MPRKSNKRKPRPQRCGCTLTCNYYMLRCDNCHRGVHFFCLKLFDPVADRPNVYVCTTCKNNCVKEARVAEIRAAEGRACSVIFRGSCQYHWDRALRGHKLLPLADEHSGEILSGADCDMCHEYSCRDYSVACHKCDVYWHMQCAHMTPEQAEGIDKWYCERCRETDPQLQTTFNDGHGTEEGGNDNLAATPPPGPSSGASAAVPAAQRKKRPTTIMEAITRLTKRRALDGPSAQIEPPNEAADAQVEQPPPVEAPANANPTVDEHAEVAEGPSTAALLEQLKQAADRIKKLEEENASLHREKAAVTASKEGLQKAFDDMKAEAAAEREKRIAAEEEVTKQNGPSSAALLEQLKHAADRNMQLEQENAALLREKTSAVAAKESLQKALDETKADAAAERETRIASEEGLKKALDETKTEAAAEKEKRIAADEDVKKALDDMKGALATEQKKRIAAEEEVTQSNALIARLTKRLMNAGQL